MNAGGALGVARLAAAGAVLTGLVRPAEARRRLRSRQYENALFNSREPERTSWALTDDGARLRVHHYGSADAPVLVLIHGWSCCIEYWNPQINALAERYHVIAYDQRGHGESTWGKRKFDADVLADDLQTVVEQAVPDSSKAVFVGHSMGGITVQAWAHRHQDRVEERAAALVLANTTWGGIAAETRVLPLLNNPLKAPLWLGQAALAIPFPFPGGRVARSLVRTRILNGRAATIDHAAFVLAMTRSCSPAARAKAAVALVELALGPVGAEAITVPTTVIGGRHDLLLPHAMTQRIAHTLSIRGYLDQLVVFDTGHASNIEAAEDFTAEIHRVMYSVSTSPEVEGAAS
ncbi:alpha/beta fold hydrolase [Gordonia amicalis]|uniref:alpha/beta fold hydrolase n=1 Tax=Gordonia amicalis TaxID=89053 RepID=UPI0002A62144|nr:alpha/beta hydrolase [Gordonia amicalis]MBA5847467.1 alpha/beta hydrolase [Gordonia amicalis]MDV7175524.1 alpha/beta hydrolase [Gordonia amicalis]NKX79527.1 alpha/beta hydrolase [Gordonia amicalis]GAC54565.1 putative hydrolase [Gordonia amicalis NBRC 100051 = JCM 11271]